MTQLFKYFYLAFAFLLVSCMIPQWKATGEGIMLLSNESRNAHSVYLAKTDDNGAAVCWTEQDSGSVPNTYFYYAIFDSESGWFKDTSQIPISQQAVLHIEGMPKIAFKSDGTVVAVYEVKIASDRNPYASEIHYTVSRDHGHTWSTPQYVHADRSPHQGRSFFDVATLTNGEIGVSWLGTSSPGGGRPVIFARTDTANMFTQERMVDSLACECCRTALSADKSGLISIVYRDILAGAIRDISVVTSVDTGKTFASPLCFSGDNWNIDGCPHNGPDVVSDGDLVYATWYTGGTASGVYFAQLDNSNRITKKELVSNDGRNIQLTNLGKGTNILVYNENRNTPGGFTSEIKAIIKPTDRHIQVSREGVLAHSPVIIAAADSTVLVAWIEKTDRGDQVYYKRIRLN